MAAAPGRRMIPFLPQAEDEVDVALIDELPEVAPKEPLPFPLADGGHAPDMPLFLDTLEAETQVFIAAQFTRLQARLDARGGNGEDVEQLRATIAHLREENARLLRQLDLFERAFRTMKELAVDVEEASR